jgi:hypothetical protein
MPIVIAPLAAHRLMLGDELAITIHPITHAITRDFSPAA